ncbi:MAG: serine/threonine-protein kinase [bacterium]|nr:serine/threonine-protein kinase [bacterium]
MNHQILSGKYELIGLLGAGAGSQVYLARHRKLEHFRAIKCISKQSLARSRFLLEAEILQSLSHPGIPTIYDLEEDEDSYYLVEEYVQGESLDAFVLRRQNLSLAFVVQLARQLCDIIKYLHSRPVPIVYQDLKPEHIIVYGNQIKIVDFGIAAYISKEGNPFQSYGTEAYAAPEKKNGTCCDERVDVYGIGKILEFLYNNLDKENQIYHLEALIEQAIAENPMDRFSCVDDLTSELLKIQTMHVKTEKHLLNRIAVIGTRHGTGTTHIAISFNVYQNQGEIPSYYSEQNRQGDLWRIGESRKGTIDSHTSVIRYGAFRGMPIGEMDQMTDFSDGTLIQDCGTYESSTIELENCQGIILVIGGKCWDEPLAKAVYEKLCMHKGLIPIVNFGNEQMARQYAKCWRRSVYCFPLDPDPFVLTNAKCRFFETLQKKEGW